MDGYRADTVALNILVDRLTSCTESMDKALNALEDVGPKSLGTKGLDDACDDFHDEWQYGLKIIREDIGKVVDALRQNVVNYDDTEGQIAGGLITMRTG
ncbi:hypothetical protein [Embleya sp. NBC_00896]|uniref:hypothetical protein n=1 Tax=Embleya sp. NBC_00896 TaxID=2975961 RepID=UPI00386CC1BD|nr:hypothetical protein OG928_12705 [Embleya sp. NBC_00896]